MTGCLLRIFSETFIFRMYDFFILYFFILILSYPINTSYNGYDNLRPEHELT